MIRELITAIIWTGIAHIHTAKATAITGNSCRDSKIWDGDNKVSIILEILLTSLSSKYIFDNLYIYIFTLTNEE